MKRHLDDLERRLREERDPVEPADADPERLHGRILAALQTGAAHPRHRHRSLHFWLPAAAAVLVVAGLHARRPRPLPVRVLLPAVPAVWPAEAVNPLAKEALQLRREAEAAGRGLWQTLQDAGSVLVVAEGSTHEGTPM